MEISEEEKERKKQLKRKINICNKLGANRFKPVVLAAEKIKFKLIKKVFPFIPEKYERSLAKTRDKALAKAKTEEEKEKIVRKYREEILDWRKELQTERNRNYHMDEHSPTKMIKYIKWNKNVHIKSLVKDLIIITATSIGIVAIGATPLLISAIIIESLAAFIDFQCINIQNSHIYRYQIIESSLKRREKIKDQSLLDKYSGAANAYAKAASKTNGLPSIESIILSANSQEELDQLKQMILAAKAKHQSSQQTKQQTLPLLNEKQQQVTPNLATNTCLHQTNSNIEQQVDLIIEQMSQEDDKKPLGPTKIKIENRNNT